MQAVEKLKESFEQHKTSQAHITVDSHHREYLFYNSETQKLGYSEKISLCVNDITCNKTGG